MDRRKFLGTTATAGLALIAKPYVAHAVKHELLVKLFEANLALREQMSPERR